MFQIHKLSFVAWWFWDIYSSSVHQSFPNRSQTVSHWHDICNVWRLQDFWHDSESRFVMSSSHWTHHWALTQHFQVQMATVMMYHIRHFPLILEMCALHCALLDDMFPVVPLFNSLGSPVSLVLLVSIVPLVPFPGSNVSLGSLGHDYMKDMYRHL